MVKRFFKNLFRDHCRDCKNNPCTCGKGNYNDAQMRVAHRIGLWSEAEKNRKHELNR